ncbi:response regulator [Alteromonas sp. ASW11-19]|uniref:histidine kinase n=1 Tax=Alteromonas salexigens TaxID=2982530 RepID=A0ABT2VQP5_9ALTE|nr:response regulator [Alteromonas salexigens]MCU7555197.1 response regulator [Alteromonas salexigens]
MVLQRKFAPRFRQCALALIVWLCSFSVLADVSRQLESFEQRLASETPMPIGQITETLAMWLGDPAYSRNEKAQIAADYAWYMITLNQAAEPALIEQLSRLASPPEYGPAIKMGLARMHSINANYEQSYSLFEQVLANKNISPRLRAVTISYLMVTNSENQAFATNGQLIDTLNDLLRSEGLTDLWPLYYNKVADYYHSIQQLDIALEHYAESLEGARENKDWVLVSDNLYASGILYRNKENYGEAIRYFEQALDNDRNIDINYSEYLALYGMATTYFRAGQLDKALTLSDRVTSHPLTSPFFDSEIYKWKAKAYLELGDPDKAREALQVSRQMFDQDRPEEQTTWRAELEQIAAFIAASEGNYKTAYEQYTQFHQAYLDAKKYDDLELIESSQLVYQIEQEKAKANMLEEENRAISELLAAQDDARETERQFNQWLIILVALTLVTLAIILILLKKSRQTMALNAKARDQAQLHNRLKSEFISNISHEIRTPLNAIIGFGQVLTEQLQDARHKKLIYQVTNSSEMLLQLINDLLDFSKIEAGKLALDPGPYNIKRSLKKLGDIFSAQAQAKELSLVFKIDPETPKLLIFDELRFKQVLANLMSNAIKFSERGKVEIGVVTAGMTDTHCRLKVWVKDTGIGISEEQQQRLFQPFTQAESSTARKFGGSGLGLHICNQLLALMGSDMQLESEPGVGTTFSFEVNLPRTRQQEKSALEADYSTEFLYTRVLLVEDNDINVEVLQAMLNTTNLDITRVENGKQALDTLANHEFDIILMDIQMPEMDGYEASRRIREQLALDTPILALTANAMQQDIDACLQVGMDGHISKPIQKSHLLGSLQPFLNPPQKTASVQGA